MLSNTKVQLLAALLCATPTALASVDKFNCKIQPEFSGQAAFGIENVVLTRKHEPFDYTSLYFNEIAQKELFTDSESDSKWTDIGIQTPSWRPELPDYPSGIIGWRFSSGMLDGELGTLVSKDTGARYSCTPAESASEAAPSLWGSLYKYLTAKVQLQDDQDNCICDGISWGYHFPDLGDCKTKCCDDFPPKTGYKYEGTHWDCP
eukprot:GFYU01023856.1.p1 GENE.GFYU01023856.1~~GFYU01023856.1.p1  ORF type:complete len:205 (-),score=33.15 GFYU01023856.1:44-658(-)